MAAPTFVRAVPASGTNAQISAAPPFTFAFDATGCDYLLVYVSVGHQSVDITGTTTSITYDGTACTQLVAFTINSGSNTAGAAVYGVSAPATGSHNFVVSESPDHTDLVVTVVGYTGVGSVGRNVTINGLNAQNITTLSLTSVTTDTLLAGGGSHGDLISGAHTGSTQRALNNASSNSAGSCNIMGDIVGNGGTTSLGFDGAGSDWWMGIAVELVGAGTPPDQVTGVTVTPGYNQHTVSWTTPLGGPTGYKVEYSTNGGSSWANASANTGTTATTYVHTGLTLGVNYRYRISAISGGGTGTASSATSDYQTLDPVFLLALEDGTSLLVLEDGTSPLVSEA